MSYSLGAVHNFVDLWLSPGGTTMSSSNNLEYRAQVAKAIDETKKLKQGFLQGAVGMNNEALQTWVNINVAGCTSLADSIHLAKEKGMFRDMNGQKLRN